MEFLKDIRICFEKPGGIGKCTILLQLGNFKLTACGRKIAQVTLRPAEHNREFHAIRFRQGAGVDAVAVFEGLLAAPEATLAVSDQRRVLVGAGDPVKGSELAQSQSVFANPVSGDARSLPHNPQTTGMRRCRHGMLVGKLRIVLFEQRNHSQVPGNEVGILFGQ
ncbi:MAG: hypothetical protein LKF88_04820 [Microbacteriaceae bacterium]|nr:hypothetical protein [Microbacteriaceae bacterium]MCI1207511.1 hypothetical protein [Microbacteriaceae bacterium]